MNGQIGGTCYANCEYCGRQYQTYPPGSRHEFECVNGFTRAQIDRLRAENAKLKLEAVTVVMNTLGELVRRKLEGK